MSRPRFGSSVSATLWLKFCRPRFGLCFSHNHAMVSACLTVRGHALAITLHERRSTLWKAESVAVSQAWEQLQTASLLSPQNPTRNLIGAITCAGAGVPCSTCLLCSAADGLTAISSTVRHGKQHHDDHPGSQCLDGIAQSDACKHSSGQLYQQPQGERAVYCQGC